MDVTKLQVVAITWICIFRAIYWLTKKPKTDPTPTRGQRANKKRETKPNKPTTTTVKKSNKIEFNKMLEHRLHIDDSDDNDKRRRAVASTDKGGLKGTVGWVNNIFYLFFYFFKSDIINLLCYLKFNWFYYGTIICESIQIKRISIVRI